MLREAFKGRIEAERLRGDDLQDSPEKDMQLLQGRCAKLEESLREARQADAITVNEGVRTRHRMEEDFQEQGLELTAACKQIESLTLAIEAKEAALAGERHASKVNMEILQNKISDLDIDGFTKKGKEEPSPGERELIVRQKEALAEVLAEIRGERSQSRAAG